MFLLNYNDKQTNKQKGGLLWFTNLAVPDIYTVLPFVAITLTWSAFSIGHGRFLDGRYSGFYHKYISRFYFILSCLPLMSIAITVDISCGIFS